ncbi:hypothetical protein N8445_00430 [bacterium]|nr:hypothetical protein [bacterium]
MKNLLLVVVLLIGFSVSAQEEVVTYQQLDDFNLIKVVKYNGETIVEEGYLTEENGRLKNTGIWKQFDKDGNVTLQVKYVKGMRKETIAYQDNKIVKVVRKD